MTKITTLLSTVLAPKQNDRVATIATRANFLTAKECSEIIRIGEQQENEPGSLVTWVHGNTFR